MNTVPLNTKPSAKPACPPWCDSNCSPYDDDLLHTVAHEITVMDTLGSPHTITLELDRLDLHGKAGQVGISLAFDGVEAVSFVDLASVEEFAEALRGVALTGSSAGVAHDCVE